jgi:hypothetical protein
MQIKFSQLTFGSIFFDFFLRRLNFPQLFYPHTVSHSRSLACLLAPLSYIYILARSLFPSFAQKLLVILKSLKSAFDVICALIFLFDCFSNFLFLLSLSLSLSLSPFSLHTHMCVCVFLSIIVIFSSCERILFHCSQTLINSISSTRERENSYIMIYNLRSVGVM